MDSGAGTGIGPGVMNAAATGVQDGINMANFNAYVNADQPVPLTGYETLFKNLGLTTPLSRVVGVGALVSAGIFIVKPSMSFHESGETRSMEEGGVPWWVIPLASGAFVYFTT